MHHAALGARDVRRLADFYAAAFELREEQEQSSPDGSLRSVWLRSGDVVLMIEATQEPPRSVQGVGAGPFLLAFPMSLDLRSASEARVIRAGGVLEGRSELSSYFRDPEGNRCALSSYPLR